jgi:hypothetical protein
MEPTLDNDFPKKSEFTNGWPAVKAETKSSCVHKNVFSRLPKTMLIQRLPSPSGLAVTA